MVKSEYGIIKPKFPGQVKLLKVPHKKNFLTVRHPPFGQGYYSKILRDMQKKHFHSNEYQDISFRESTTSESLSAVGYGFGERMKRKISGTASLQIGRIVRTSEGVFANPPKDEQGSPLIDEEFLRSLLDKAKKVNGIYLGDNDFGFAPYETFKTGAQKPRTFCRGGLARLLEHTEAKTAKIIQAIASPEFYPEGVYVADFHQVKELVSAVVSISTNHAFSDCKLLIWGEGQSGLDNGYTFGVLN